jgi:hypothetical protein
MHRAARRSGLIVQNSGRSLNLRHILVAIDTLDDFLTLMEEIPMDRVEDWIWWD